MIEAVPTTPAELDVRLVCPECSRVVQVVIKVKTELVVGDDPNGSDDPVTHLRSVTKNVKVEHVHSQMTLDDVAG